MPRRSSPPCATCPIPGRVRSLLEIESGFNEPMAVLLTLGVLAAVQGDPTAGDWVWLGSARSLEVCSPPSPSGSEVRGSCSGRELRSSAAAAVAALSVAGLSYGAATTLGGSGLLAAYAAAPPHDARLAGVVVGHRVTRHKRLIVGRHDALSEAGEIGLFLLLGMLVFPSELPDQAGRAVAVAAVLVFVARPLAVGVLMPWFGFTTRELPVLAWAGCGERSR